jgi:hypothetical protein
VRTSRQIDDTTDQREVEPLGVEHAVGSAFAGEMNVAHVLGPEGNAYAHGLEIVPGEFERFAGSVRASDPGVRYRNSDGGIHRIALD